MLSEEAVIGTTKVLCTQGEVLSAQVSWSIVRRNSTSDYIKEATDSAVNDFQSTCFECECMIDLIKRNISLQLQLNDASEGAEYASFTTTGYYLPNSFDLFLTSLKCTGIPNWFLSILLIKNVSTSTAGKYEMEIQSNVSRVNYTSGFTLKAGNIVTQCLP